MRSSPDPALLRATELLPGEAVPYAHGALRLPRSRVLSEVLERPFHLGLGALVGGLALASTTWEGAAALAGVVLLVVAGLGRPALGLLLAALVLAGTGVGATRLDMLERSLVALPPGTGLAADAFLVEHPRPGRFGSSAVVEVASGPAAGTWLLARGGRELRWPPDAPIGAVLAVKGGVKAPRSRPGAGFDWAAYLRRRGIAAELELDALRSTGVRRGGLSGAVDAMRVRAERALSQGLRPARTALLRGMVLGEDEQISPEVRDDFRRSGLAHLLAVSGQNVMLLGALALPFLAAMGCGLRARLVAVLMLIGLYVPLAGAGPSLQRAGVMGAAGTLALALGRPASRWYGLLLAAAVTLVVNPRVLGDPGWQLSFAAVAGILWWGPGLRRALRGLPGPLAEGVALTLSATAATAPLLAHHFGSVSLASLPANVLALPAVAPIMWIGMAQAAIAQLGALGPAVDWVAGAIRLLGLASDPMLAYLEWLGGVFAEAPGAAISLPLGRPLAVVLAYMLLALAGAIVPRAARALEPWSSTAWAAWRRVPFVRRLAMIFASLALVAALAAVLLTPRGPPDRLTVSFLDVGQGDATLIQHPDGAAILFDGGPPEARVARLVRGAGVRRLSAVVVTHAARDHQGGLPEVLREVPTEVLLDGGDGSSDAGLRAVYEEAARQGVPRVPAVAGRTLTVGGLTIRVLSPEPRPPGPSPDAPDLRAVVAVVSSGGLDLFLSADAESPSLTGLDLPDVEAMKVPHHGSRDPGLPAVLDRLRPQVAAIEVGAGNSYGHPTPETLAALRAAVPQVYRTDRDGTVTLSVDSAGLEVEAER